MRTSYESLHADHRPLRNRCHREAAAEYVRANVQRRSQADQQRRERWVLGLVYAVAVAGLVAIYLADHLTR